MKKLLSFILLLFVLMSSCKPKGEAPVNEEPTLFSRLGDSDFWRERYLETFWKEENDTICQIDILFLHLKICRLVLKCYLLACSLGGNGLLLLESDTCAV